MRVKSQLLLSIKCEFTNTEVMEVDYNKFQGYTNKICITKSKKQIIKHIEVIYNVHKIHVV